MRYYFQNTFTAVTPKPDYGAFRSKDPGQDLSGSLQGAGGVGGLLFAQLNNPATSNLTTVCYCMDGNGNVMGLVSADTGSVAAEYDYSSAGETLKATGPLAKANPFRFSTKPVDDETGVIAFQARPYWPTLAIFLCRDPIEEQGGLNLHGICGGDCVNGFDGFGLFGPSDYVDSLVYVYVVPHFEGKKPVFGHAWLEYKSLKVVKFPEGEASSINVFTKGFFPSQDLYGLGLDAIGPQGWTGIVLKDPDPWAQEKKFPDKQRRIQVVREVSQEVALNGDASKPCSCVTDSERKETFEKVSNEFVQSGKFHVYNANCHMLMQSSLLRSCMKLSSKPVSGEGILSMVPVSIDKPLTLEALLQIEKDWPEKYKALKPLIDFYAKEAGL